MVYYYYYLFVEQAVSLVRRTYQFLVFFFRERYIIVEQAVQPLALHHVIVKTGWRRVLVFTHTRDSAHRLALLLQTMANSLYQVGEFSAKLGRWQKKMTDNFSKGLINV